MTIYYLPARDLVEPEREPIASRWSVLRARAWRGWCRLRLTAAEVVSALRRSGRRSRLDDHVWFAPEPPAARRRPLGPARIIDLEAARRRRTAAASA
jgi:hypothetical protein